MEDTIIFLLQLQVGKYIFTLQQLQKTDLFRTLSAQRCHVFFNMAYDFEVYFVGRCALISKLNYYHFGSMLGDHCYVVLICISTVQYISMWSIFLSHNILSSADSRMISSVASSEQNLIAVISYLGNSLVLSEVVSILINLLMNGIKNRPDL